MSGPAGPVNVAFGVQWQARERVALRSEFTVGYSDEVNEEISLTEIPQIIESVMNDHANQPAKDIQTILAADHDARLAARSLIADPIRVHP